jgi:hypothetical protein
MWKKEDRGIKDMIQKIRPQAKNVSSGYGSCRAFESTSMEVSE